MKQIKNMAASEELENKEELDGIEEEKGNENITTKMPFDPDDINVHIVPRTIGQLVEMLKYDEILIPKYQRLPNLWSIKKKSRFIESLMLNLPIPLFYFDERKDKKWLVVDGLQRISALTHFILNDKNKNNPLNGFDNPFKLEGLEFRTEFNGETWETLPRDVKRRISTNQVTINLISKGTPEQVKYTIFSRINEGATILKPQEIRTALFQGDKIEFIESLVSKNTEQGKAFKKSTDGSVPSKRQQDLDFATRFVSFYLLGYEKYEPDMVFFMTEGTKNIPSDENEKNEIIVAFKNAMNLAYKLFGKYAFRKRKKEDINTNKRSQINKPLFEVISVAFAKLDKIDRDELLNCKEMFLDAFFDLQEDKKFWSAISTGTATKDSVEKRHSKFDELIFSFII